MLNSGIDPSPIDWAGQSAQSASVPTSRLTDDKDAVTSASWHLVSELFNKQLSVINW